jgi:hypothetical protein
VEIRKIWRAGHVGVIPLILAGHFKAYGMWNFFSSVILGIFLGWVWGKKIFPSKGYFALLSLANHGVLNHCAQIAFA